MALRGIGFYSALPYQEVQETFPGREEGGYVSTTVQEVADLLFESPVLTTWREGPDTKVAIFPVAERWVGIVYASTLGLNLGCLEPSLGRLMGYKTQVVSQGSLLGDGFSQQADRSTFSIYGAWADERPLAFALGRCLTCDYPYHWRDMAEGCHVGCSDECLARPKCQWCAGAERRKVGLCGVCYRKVCGKCASHPVVKGDEGLQEATVCLPCVDVIRR